MAWETTLSRIQRPLTKKCCKSAWLLENVGSPIQPQRRIPERSLSTYRACCINAGPQISATRFLLLQQAQCRPQIDLRTLIVAQAKGDIHAAERQFFNAVIDAVVFCALGAQKLAPRRGIKEQVAHLDAGALRMGCRLQTPPPYRGPQTRPSSHCCPPHWRSG